MTATFPDCPRCGSASEAGDLRCPVCYLAVPHAATDDGDAVRVHVFRCPSCAAAMEYSARAQAPLCAFCGSVLKVEHVVDPVEQTETYVPFTVDRRTATDAYRRWLSQQGFFRPSDLASAAQLESLRALWWVGWMVNADALVTWTLDSNADARKAGWAPHAGELQTTFENIVIPATRGLSLAECTRLIPSYAVTNGTAARIGDRSAATESSGAVEPTAVRERFGMSRSAARGLIVTAIQRMAEARLTREAPGTKFRNVRAAVHLRGLRTRRLSLPAYAIVYRYRGRLYRTVISGQDPTCIIGRTPRSLAKLILVIALIVAGMAAAVAIGLMFK